MPPCHGPADTIPGYIWHLTHCCHRKQFLPEFLRDRCTWVDRLHTARLRFGPCVLNYNLTSNHVHLIVRVRGGDEIARSLQFIAGRTGQQFNKRKHRRGAIWEDRYHVTAIESGEYLARCLVYVDLNMVRAGALAHSAIAEALEISVADLGELHAERIAEALAAGSFTRRGEWSSSLAVGGRKTAARIQSALKSRANGREPAPFESFDDSFVLHEPEEIFGRRFGGENPRQGLNKAVREDKAT